MPPAYPPSSTHQTPPPGNAPSGSAPSGNPTTGITTHPTYSALAAIAAAREQLGDVQDRLDKIDTELRQALVVLATTMGILGGPTESPQ